MNTLRDRLESDHEHLRPHFSQRWRGRRPPLVAQKSLPVGGYVAGRHLSRNDFSAVHQQRRECEKGTDAMITAAAMVVLALVTFAALIGFAALCDRI